MTDKTIYFPFDKPRESQKDLMDDIYDAIINARCHIAHAPTGLGKTVASLAPAITYAVEKKKTIFFLTSRNTQHKIAIETIKEINDKYNLKLNAIDIIGKKNLCIQQGIAGLNSNDFTDLCKKYREEDSCTPYLKTRTKKLGLTIPAKVVRGELKEKMPLHAKDIHKICQREDLCPYEMTVALAKDAHIIVCDYYYIFNESIREVFLKKIEKDIDDLIIIVDEAHNLADRLRELMSQKISSFTLRRASKEAVKNQYEEIEEYIFRIEKFFYEFYKEKKLSKFNSEIAIKKENFKQIIDQIGNYEDISKELIIAGENILETQKQSSINTIGVFLKKWLGEDFGYTRIFSVDFKYRDPNFSLGYNCLDPSLISSQILNDAHSVICMSGTLTPTLMYKDVLGFPKNTTQKEYSCPFSKKNRLVLIDTNVTTKFAVRSEQQFVNISNVCVNISERVPGNVAIFFPSYALKEKIAHFFITKTTKTVIEEHAGMTKEEKEELINKFKSYHKTGAVLLGVTSGSFGEGIDLPGHFLKGVIIVGLPLQPPTLNTKELINYYNVKFNKGWDYGYTLPAITKSLQNAGRCIRTETDKGIIAFLDNRYAFPNYFKCFPKDWNIQIGRDLYEKVDEFFLD
jgi:DNA excision repair protein ERCC-2